MISLDGVSSQLTDSFNSLDMLKLTCSQLTLMSMRADK
jgi:hypothetical protein